MPKSDIGRAVLFMRWRWLLPACLWIASCSTGTRGVAQTRPVTPQTAQPTPAPQPSQAAPASQPAQHVSAEEMDASAPSEALAGPEQAPLPDGVVIDPDSGVMYTYSIVPLVDASTNVATGRGVQITAGELLDRLREAPAVLQQNYATTDGGALAELLDRMVADRLLVAEARRRGLENDPQVRAAVERALVARLRATVINPAAGDGTAITDEEIRAWYEAHPERFHVPERRRVRVVFSTDARHAQEVLQLALLRRRNRPAHEFRRLAAEHNADVTLRSMSGDLRDITPEPMVGSPELDQHVRDAIFAMLTEEEVLPRVVPGQWRGQRGFFVIQFLGRRRPEDRSFESSAEWIRQRIVLERRVEAERQRVEDLAREAGVRRTPLERVVRFEQQVVPFIDAGVSADAAPLAAH